jgi:hypothetical protein
MINFLPTRVFDLPVFAPSAGDILVVGASSAEDRFSIPEDWFDVLSDAGGQLMTIVGSDGESINVTLGNDVFTGVSLFDADTLGGLFGRAETVWVDMTALTHDVWAPILRALLVNEKNCRYLYSEPVSYAPPTRETAGLQYALSSSIGRIAPLPGFARTRAFEPGEAVFIPMLGFEGNRLAHARDSIEAEADGTYPILGVPGFQPDYPFVSLIDNYRVLKDHPIPSRIGYARAFCPFDAYAAIEHAHIASGLSGVQVAPIGTKPHALGAVLYVLGHQKDAELIYDHPQRAENRSRGRGKTWEYNISAFLKSRVP